MIDYHKTLKDTLNAILPTHYEMVLKSGYKTPCLSYMELNNAVEAEGNTIGYSNIIYQVKVWDNDIANIQKYVLLVDKAMRSIGFKRIGSTELYDYNSTMIQKVLTYEALALEEYN